jgi:PhzF family phenazine biosynthesis protein
MKTYRIKQVNAFTSRPFSGNPAGVVLDARGLTDAKMQAIAREMNLSETAFILPSTLERADLQIRWFTPSVEVPLCGHATIASFHALAEEGMYGMKRTGTYTFRLQTKSGVLPVSVEKKYSGTVVDFELPVPVFHSVRALPDRLVHALGLKVTELQIKLPVVRNSYLYVPVRRLTTLQKLKPDYQSVAEATHAMNVLGVCVFTLQTVEESSAVHSRFFAPAAGIPEDPVTGSANGPLGVYLYTYVFDAGLDVPWLRLPDGRMEFIGEQGDALNRKGRVKIRLSVHRRQVEQVSIAGEAVTIYNAELQV